MTSCVELLVQPLLMTSCVELLVQPLRNDFMCGTIGATTVNDFMCGTEYSLYANIINTQQLMQSGEWSIINVVKPSITSDQWRI